MLLAAVLLSSVSAMAQSGNNEPLKGDVNEDGTVDVADIVDVIKIIKDAGGAVGEKMCYWYAGTNGGNAVTADNFTDVASRIPESEIPETGSVTAKGQYIYFVMPESRHLESLSYANGSAVEFTFTNVMGYHIYKTTEMINTTLIYTIKQTTYYWYVGTTPVDGTNYTSIASQVTSIPKTTTITLNNEYLYIVAPADKTVTVVDRDGFGTAMKTYNSSTGTFTHAFTTVNGYAIYKSVGEDTNEEIITISENIYN